MESLRCLCYTKISLRHKQLEVIMGKSDRISANNQDNKIISMALDANFFFERALHYLDRNNYTKALKYFWRTVDAEPNNPVHYCNIAGLLSEMEKFNESNEMLLYVVEKIDPSLAECYYYLANNYAHLEEFETSYKYINRYLEVAPNGEYVEDAKEILEYLRDEVDHPIMEEEQETKELLVLHQKAKQLLEDGDFHKAIKQLQQMVEDYPDFLAAKNNLALAYFYIGNSYEAINHSKFVLEQERTNIHALCNLAIFYQQLNEQKELEYILAALRKIELLDTEALYKLATTFAILGDHEMAFKHTQRIIRKINSTDKVILHYGAVAAFNTGKYETAKKWWEQILRLDSRAQIAQFYLTQLQSVSESAFLLPTFCYQYELPFNEMIRMLQIQPDLLVHPFVHRSVSWGIEHLDNVMKEQLLLILGLFKDLKEIDVEGILRSFLLSDNQAISLKKRVLLVLDEMNAESPYKVSINGKIVEMERQIPDFSLWKKQWLDIIKMLEKQLPSRYSIVELYDAKMLWYDFISHNYPNVPQIRKVEGWVAAIEYIIADTHGRKVTIEELANSYGVSKQTVSKHIHVLDNTFEYNY